MVYLGEGSPGIMGQVYASMNLRAWLQIAGELTEKKEWVISCKNGAVVIPELLVKYRPIATARSLMRILE